MSKELEALERLYCACRLDLDYVLNGKQKEDFETIEKELKALEIIKKKEVNVDMLFAIKFDYDFYKSYVELHEWKEKYILTQEEYDLLKEVLL